MPLPSTRVVHPQWSEHHYPVVAGTQTATCKILRQADGAVVPSGITSIEPAEFVVWTGPCRVQAQSQGNQLAGGADQNVTTMDYLVSVPHDIPPIRVGDDGDVVVVTANPDDPQLVDRRLQVMEALYGSLIWERDLMCQDDMSANNPPVGGP